MKNLGKKIGFRTVLLAALLVFAAVGVGYALTRNQSPTTTNPTPQEEFVATPPTEEEKSAGDDTKSKAVDREKETAPTTNTKKTVTPVITSAGQFGQQIEVRTLVPGVYEATGTCTATFTQGGTKLTREVEGIKDATTTRCDTVAVLRNDFPKAGTWSVVMEYNSPTAKGTSNKVSFEVK